MKVFDGALENDNLRRRRQLRRLIRDSIDNVTAEFGVCTKIKLSSPTLASFGAPFADAFGIPLRSDYTPRLPCHDGSTFCC